MIENLCRRVEVENNPSPLELKIGKRKEGENLLQIRTNPPSPQCFSASRGPDKAAPLKASRSKPQVSNGYHQKTIEDGFEHIAILAHDTGMLLTMHWKLFRFSGLLPVIEAR